MEKNSLAYIENCLANLNPIIPLVPPDIVSRNSFCPGVKAVLFDIYGTLLVSDSGDFRQEKLYRDRVARALRESGIIVNDPEVVISNIIIQYHIYIKEHHSIKKASGIEHPEIDILMLWKSVWKRLSELKLLETSLDDIDLRESAIVFELFLNPVYPMPSLADVISVFKSKKLVLGAVSNAQFYTPVIMNYFIDGKVSFASDITVFSPGLSVFSYKAGIAKPARKLFETAAERLFAEYGITPAETIFVGNDMLNDIYPANKTGFKTVLFAGDSRSLRKRQENALVQSHQPDYIIKDLRELLNIVGC